jgi:PadR family transcriptional regulator PadR
MSSMLGTFEYQILAVLVENPVAPYGATIGQRIKDRIGRDVSMGALYTTLDRLEKKGFVSSWWGEPTPERGGRRKRYFRIEAAGVAAARRSESILERFRMTRVRPFPVGA